MDSFGEGLNLENPPICAHDLLKSLAASTIYLVAGFIVKPVYSRSATPGLREEDHFLKQKDVSF